VPPKRIRPVGPDLLFPNSKPLLEKEVSAPGLVLQRAEKRQLGRDGLALGQFLLDLIEGRPGPFEVLLETFLKAQVRGNCHRRDEKEEK